MRRAAAARRQRADFKLATQVAVLLFSFKFAAIKQAACPYARVCILPPLAPVRLQSALAPTTEPSTVHVTLSQVSQPSRERESSTHTGALEWWTLE